MHFGPLENFAWWAGLSLEVVVCALALYRGLFRREPFFTTYLVLLVASEAIIWLTYYFTGWQSTGAFATYWSLQAILLLARGAVLAELCRCVLGPYTGVWRFSRSVLTGIAGVLVVAAAIAAHQAGNHIGPFIRTADRGLELAIVGVLLFALAFCRYYRIRIDRVVVMVALGLGFYSAVQVANNTILSAWLKTYFNWWNQVRALSFNVATFLWLVALWRPLPEAQPAPVLLDQETYDELSPQLSFRLRQLNARLSEMLK